MRLICPNCGAQYEVADDVIPVAGRDVQCSNCGHTWFEHPGASEAAEAGEPLPPPPPEPEPRPSQPAEPESEPEPVAQDVASAADFPAESPPDHADPMPEAVPPEELPPEVVLPEETVLTAAGPQRRGLSPDLAGILREEAEREAAARAAEAAVRQTVYANPAPAVDIEEQRGEEARRRMARMRGEPAPAVGAPVTPTPTARRELLPDIEEINSSLRSTTDREGIAPAEPATHQRKRGARFGFSTIMLLVAILVGIYLGAARLSALIPAAEPVLTRYVDVVNDARLWIDLQMQAFIAGQSDTATVPDPANVPAPPDADAPAVETQVPALETPPAENPAPETEAPAEPPTEQTNN